MHFTETVSQLVLLKGLLLLRTTQNRLVQLQSTVNNLIIAPTPLMLHVASETRQPADRLLF